MSEEPSIRTFYVYGFYCSNCTMTTWRNILKGTKVKDYKEKIICINCGCEIEERR